MADALFPAAPRAASDSPLDPWETPAVLSLDGGGIRGLSSLMILKELFKEVAARDPQGQHDTNRDGDLIARPCHYIDHMVGTSTGGLISILLGRLRLPLQEVIDIYLQFADKVFKRPRALDLLPYSAKALKQVVHQVLKNHCGEQEERMLQTDYKYNNERRCMTSVVAQKRQFGRAEETYLFRSYDHILSDDDGLGDPLNPGYANINNPEVRIWEVARATTAAPTYFPEMRIGDHRYMDGGAGANNPAEEAWHNARQISRNPRHWISVFISVGTGKIPHITKFGRNVNLWALIKYGKQNIVGTERPHKAIESIVSNQDEPQTFYRRFNVETGLDQIKLSEWKTLSRQEQTLKRMGTLNQSSSGSSEQRNMPTLRDQGTDYVGRGILKDGYEYLTLDAIEKLTRKYLRPARRPADAGITKDIEDSAQRLVDLAHSRRAANARRWEFFLSDGSERRLNRADLNYPQG